MKGMMKIIKSMVKIMESMKNFIYCLFIIALIFTATNKLFAYDSLLFKPLTANHLESRIGFFYQLDKEKLRLDIGHSLDMYEFVSTEDLTVRAGGDFFILSRLRSEGNMKFPVETSDFYFGLNCTGRWKKLSALELDCSARLRIGHISSHLVDGYTFQRDDTTFFREEPFVYSREFVDLVLALNSKYMRFYLGGTYVFSTIPKDINKFVGQVGVDFQIPIYRFIDIVGGYDLKSNKDDWGLEWSNSSVQLGVLINLSKNIGISLNYYNYSGYSIHGMFYNQKENYNGFGIQINY
jgi:hypothetical protein